MRYARKTRGARLGQHFLTGQWAARALARAAEVRAGETILEIGPGKGALTKELLATGNKVVAVEKDEVLVGQLEDAFAHETTSGALTLVSQDIRNFDVASSNLIAGTYVVAANIPYYITGEIVRTFLTAKKQPRAMALLVQKEVAERIIARDGKESILSLSVKAYGAPKIVAKVSRGNFSPPPSVDSAILLIENISRTFFVDVDESVFFKIVRAGFASKRKFLVSNLCVFGKENVSRALAACGISEKARAEDVPLEKWKLLALKLGVRS